MRFELHDDAELRRVFLESAATEEPAEGCGEAERIWAAARGELSAGEVRAVVDHVATCPSCAVAWRLAVELDPSSRSAAAGSRSLGAWKLVSALAAAVVLFVGVSFVPELLRPEPELRGGVPGPLEALVDEAEPQPRSALVLRWVPIEGASYDLWVTTESLDEVATFRDLGEPRQSLSPEALGNLPEGAKLLWRIEARLSDGRREASETFVVRLE